MTSVLRSGFGKIWIVLILMLASGCATSSPVVRDFCLVYQPVLPTAAERAIFTPETEDMIDGNNLVFQELCGERTAS